MQNSAILNANTNEKYTEPWLRRALRMLWVTRWARSFQHAVSKSFLKMINWEWIQSSSGSSKVCQIVNDSCGQSFTCLQCSTAENWDESRLNITWPIISSFPMMLWLINEMTSDSVCNGLLLLVMTSNKCFSSHTGFREFLLIFVSHFFQPSSWQRYNLQYVSIMEYKRYINWKI